VSSERPNLGVDSTCFCWLLGVRRKIGLCIEHGWDGWARGSFKFLSRWALRRSLYLNLDWLYLTLCATRQFLDVSSLCRCTTRRNQECSDSLRCISSPWLSSVTMSNLQCNLLLHNTSLFTCGFFQRSSVAEFLTFFSKTVAERTRVGQRQDVEENSYLELALEYRVLF